MNRRDWILQAGSSAVAFGVTTQAFAADKAAEKTASTEAGKFAKLVQSTQDCIRTGTACISHCQKELAKGNKAMAECLQSVLELVAACETLNKLALYESAYTKDFAKLTGKICGDCAKICEKHAHHMEACKACGEACKACEKDCLAA